MPTTKRYLRRPHLYRRAGLVALAAVVGPGVLAGLSDDDPPGITTYSVLGADFGYRLLWVLVLSTATLIVFHLLAARVGIVTGMGFTALVRHRYGARSALGAGDTARPRQHRDDLRGARGRRRGGGDRGHPAGGRGPAVAVGVTVFVVSGTFHRVEHVFLALSAALAAYIVAGILSGPDWHAAARGMVVPSLPAGRHALVLVSATIGTTLAPWGLAFMQSYAVDKKLKVEDWRFERLDVVAGAVMTGIVGFFIVVACAETLHAHGLHVNDASDAARALRPLAGNAASALFAVGLFGAALLAAAILPLSTAYSVSEAAGRSANVDGGLRDEPFFYGMYILVLAVAAAIVLLPVGLVPLLVLSQVLNTFLLLPLMVVLVLLSRDPSVMGEHASRGAGTIVAVAGMLLVAVSSATLAVVALLG